MQHGGDGREAGRACLALISGRLGKGGWKIWGKGARGRGAGGLEEMFGFGP